jgi:flagellar protein FliT
MPRPTPGRTFKPEIVNAAQLIDNFESVAALTSQMHTAAERGEWDRLIDFEQQRSLLVGAMQPVAAEIVLDSTTTQHRNRLIDKVLADDAEIRALAQVWMEQMRLAMQSDQQELRLLKEYGAR